MKKSTFIFTLFLFTHFIYGNDTSNYEKVMLNKIETLQNAKSLEEFQAVANAFERIAQKEETEWLPLYYAAFSYINMGFNDSLNLDEKDQYFNRAAEILEKASGIESNNSEITALLGYALMGKLSADAVNRGQTLSPQVMQLFGKAIQQDPKNPRALFLMAQMEFGMAQFFGSGTDKACQMAKQSQNLYEQSTETGIQPKWGAMGAKEMASRCQ